jgi:single-strand DNA-binding protein
VASVNKVTLIGNLGCDPDTKYTKAGKAVCNFSLATTERFNDRDGKQQEKTEWHKIVVYDKRAEACSKCIVKGSQVYVEGKIQTRAWEGQDGGKRYITEIIANEVVFLGGKSPSQGQRQQNQPSSTEQPDTQQSGEEEDVPF